MKKRGQKVQQEKIAMMHYFLLLMVNIVLNSGLWKHISYKHNTSGFAGLGEAKFCYCVYLMIARIFRRNIFLL